MHAASNSTTVLAAGAARPGPQSSCRWRVGPVRGAALAVLAAACSGAWSADDINSVTLFKPNQPGVTTQSTTQAVTVVATSTEGAYRSHQMGQADAATQTLRAVNELGVNVSRGSFDAQTHASFSKVVEVSSAAAGLVPVDVALRLDGRLHAGSAVDLEPLHTANTSLRYRVFDLDDVVCGEDCEPLLVAEFRFDGRLRFDGNHEGLITWSGFGLASGHLSDVYEEFSGAGFVNRVVDTGLQTLSFEVLAGHRLRIDASIWTFIQGYDFGGVGADFGSTFDAGLTSSMAGVQFVGETPGVFTSPVPEPASWALWLAGLAAVARVSRQRLVHRALG